MTHGHEHITTHKEQQLANANGMTSKKALSNLKGTLQIQKAQLIQGNRNGDDTSNLEKQIAVTEYAIAAVKTFVASRKSALKAAEALPAVAPTRQAESSYDDQL